jgi:hypothetical protein
MVDTGRRLAERVDARAVWYAYGTVAYQGDYGPKTGSLNDLLDQEREAAERAAEEQAVKPKPRARQRKAVAAC